MSVDRHSHRCLSLLLSQESSADIFLRKFPFLALFQKCTYSSLRPWNRILAKSIEQSEKLITQTIKVLNTSLSLLDLNSIRLAGGGISLHRFLPTKGVLNCDKLIFTNTRLTSDMTVAFTKWLHWKQGQKNSRRHLIFERCDLLYDRDFIYGNVSCLKEAFLTATSPVNYVITYNDVLISEMEFCLENKETGERFTMLKFPVEEYGKTVFRIWRRIPIEDDNQKNLDAEHLSMLAGECVANDSFDKDFYNF
ncbi:hypothetical protein Ddc_14095 [Ditylenchus destructor]|nr:hypothetical protein Ddc_14095 [Ditylenchus destructor]